MPSISKIRADNAVFSPSYLPVALFVGGTSGIGQAAAEAFARYTKGDAHIIICGRNRAAAESIIASLHFSLVISPLLVPFALPMKGLGNIYITSLY